MRLLQVEMNTISSGFAGLSSKVTDIHKKLFINSIENYKRYLDRKESSRRKKRRQQQEQQQEQQDDPLVSSAPSSLAHETEDRGSVANDANKEEEEEEEEEEEVQEQFLQGTLPSNMSLTRVADALSTAHRMYCVKYNPSCRPVVAMVVASVESNSIDQVLVERALSEEHHVDLIRVTFNVLSIYSHIEEDGRLKLSLPHSHNQNIDDIDGDVEISVVYYRTGYSPDDYRDETDWRIREDLENTIAIKCPSIGYHLVGTKKIQQILSKKEVIARFLKDGRAVDAILEVFAGIFSLDKHEDSSVSYLIKDAVQNPHLYVMKPQREGGGNNFYNNSLKERLQTMSNDERRAYILMEKIVPKPRKARLVRNNNLIVCDCVCELGIFATFLGDGMNCLINTDAGHLLRVKPTSADEGGVAAGYAVLSSPLLVNDEDDEAEEDDDEEEEEEEEEEETRGNDASRYSTEEEREEGEGASSYFGFLSSSSSNREETKALEGGEGELDGEFLSSEKEARKSFFKFIKGEKKQKRRDRKKAYRKRKKEHAGYALVSISTKVLFFRSLLLFSLGLAVGNIVATSRFFGRIWK